MTQVGYTHLDVLLDRSGSMNTIKDDMQGALRQIVTDQQNETGTATFALRQFDDQYEVVIAPRDITEVQPDQLTISPRNETALIDSMAKAINECGEWLTSMKEGDRPEHVVFTVISDGKENASKEWTRDQVFELVRKQREEFNWTFVFMGANQDAIKEAGAFGIPKSGAMTYAASTEGTQSLAAAYSGSVSSLRSGGSFELPDDASEYGK